MHLKVIYYIKNEIVKKKLLILLYESESLTNFG